MDGLLGLRAVPDTERTRGRVELSPWAGREGQVPKTEGVVAQRLDRPTGRDPFGRDRGPEDRHGVTLRAVVDAADGAQVYGGAGFVRAFRPGLVVSTPDPGGGP